MKSALETLKAKTLSGFKGKPRSKLQRVLFAMGLLIVAMIIAIICSISPQSVESNPAEAQAVEEEKGSVSEIVEIPNQINSDDEFETSVSITSRSTKPQSSSSQSAEIKTKDAKSTEPEKESDSNTSDKKSGEKHAALTENSVDEENERSGQNAEEYTLASSTSKAKCSHNWTPVINKIEHPRIEKKIKHAAKFDMQNTLHTVCNECHEVIDGHANEHLDQTGHVGFSTSVPIQEKILVSDAWTETVIDQEAWTETEVKGYVCTKCKAESKKSA